MKPKFQTSRRLAVSIIILTGSPLLAANLTWDGGGGDASWLTGGNWVGDPASPPTFGIDSVQTFNASGALNLANYLGGSVVIGALDFNASAGTDVSVVLADLPAAGTASNLTFDVTAGSASINVDASAAGNFTLGVSDGNIVLNDSLSVVHNGTGNLILNRPIVGTGTGISKSGTGNLTLAGENTFNGPVTFSAGTLTLDYAGSDTSKLPDAAALTLAGGTINLSGGTHAEAVGSTTIAAGGTQLSRSVGSTAVLALGAITRNPYGTLNISTDNIATTTTVPVNGILGGAITRFGRFAKKTGDNIVINSGETLLPTGATTAISNYTSGGNITRTEDGTVYSLRYQAGAAPLRAVNLGGFALTIDSGGLILVSNNINQILNGTLKGSASGELIVHCVGTIPQVIDAKISDNGGATALVKAGPIALNLGNATNDYTGPTYINQGSLTATASEVIPDVSTVTIFTGASLDLGANTETVSTVVLDGGSISASAAGSLINTGSAYDMRSGTVAAKLGGALGLVKSTKGTLTLSAVNTYTGGTIINDGIIKAGLANIFNTGNGTPVAINSPGILDTNGKGIFISTFSGNGTVDNTSAISNTLQIGKNGVGGAFSGLIRNSGGGNLSLWKWGAGTTVLEGANTYTGLTWCVAGILSVNSIGSIAAPSPSAMGAPIDETTGAIRFGSGAASGTLRYTGATTSTDRPIDLRGSTGDGILAASGTGPITFTGNVIATGAGSKALVLTGTNTELNTFAGQIVDNSEINTTSLIKNGDGTWALTSINPYTGTTTVNAGTLVLGATASISQSAGIDVKASAEFDISGIAAGTYNIGNLIPQSLGGGGSIDATDKAVVLGSSATLSPGDGAGPLEINLGTGSLDISAASSLVFELGTSSDRVNLPSGSLNIGGGAIGFSDFTFSDAGGLTAGDYILFQSTSLTGTLAPADLSGTIGTFGGTLSISGQNVVLTVTGGSSPFQTWIDGFSAQIPLPADREPTADPDNDGTNNLAEFALKGNPASGSNNGLVAVLVQDTDEPADTQELTLIAAVRRGAVFAANGQNAQQGSADQVSYTVEGSLVLDFWTSAVSALAAGTDTAPAASGLTEDLTGTDWEYRTFSLDASEGLTGKGFLRVKVSP